MTFKICIILTTFLTALPFISESHAAVDDEDRPLDLGYISSSVCSSQKAISMAIRNALGRNIKQSGETVTFWGEDTAGLNLTCGWFDSVLNQYNSIKDVLDEIKKKKTTVETGEDRTRDRQAGKASLARHMLGQQNFQPDASPLRNMLMSPGREHHVDTPGLASRIKDKVVDPLNKKISEYKDTISELDEEKKRLSSEVERLDVLLKKQKLDFDESKQQLEAQVKSLVTQKKLLQEESEQFEKAKNDQYASLLDKHKDDLDALQKKHDEQRVQTQKETEEILSLLNPHSMQSTSNGSPQDLATIKNKIEDFISSQEKKSEKLVLDHASETQKLKDDYDTEVKRLSESHERIQTQYKSQIAEKDKEIEDLSEKCKDLHAIIERLLPIEARDEERKEKIKKEIEKSLDELDRLTPLIPTAEYLESLTTSLWDKMRPNEAKPDALQARAYTTPENFESLTSFIDKLVESESFSGESYEPAMLDIVDKIASAFGLIEWGAYKTEFDMGAYVFSKINKNLYDYPFEKENPHPSSDTKASRNKGAIILTLREILIDGPKKKMEVLAGRNWPIEDESIKKLRQELMTRNASYGALLAFGSNCREIYDAGDDEELGAANEKATQDSFSNLTLVLSDWLHPGTNRTLDTLHQAIADHIM